MSNDTNVQTVPQADDQLYQQLLDYATADFEADRSPGFILSASFDHLPDCDKGGKGRDMPPPWILFVPGERDNVIALMNALGEYFKRPALSFSILDETTQSKPQQFAIRCQLRDGLQGACSCLHQIARQAFEFAKRMGFVLPADDPTTRARAYLESKTGQNGKLTKPAKNLLAAIDAYPDAVKIDGDESGIRHEWCAMDKVVPGSRRWFMIDRDDRSLTFIPGRVAARA